ncbi:MAG: PqqD family peptide modification chaperone [Pyrinomonadaceae bacterium]
MENVKAMVASKQMVMLEDLPALDRIVVANKHLLSSEVRGEAVILNIPSGTYYGLDVIGSRIWQLIQEPASLKFVLEILLDEYEVERSDCESDLVEYIENLSKKGLVHFQN